MHFVGGANLPFPQPIEYPGRELSSQEHTAKSWETVTFDEMVSPEVRALLEGG